MHTVWAQPVCTRNQGSARTCTRSGFILFQLEPGLCQGLHGLDPRSAWSVQTVVPARARSVRTRAPAGARNVPTRALAGAGGLYESSAGSRQKRSYSSTSSRREHFDWSAGSRWKRSESTASSRQERSDSSASSRWVRSGYSGLAATEVLRTTPGQMEGDVLR